MHHRVLRLPPTERYLTRAIAIRKAILSRRQQLDPHWVHSFPPENKSDYNGNNGKRAGN